MTTSPTHYETIDQYIASCFPGTQPLLQKIKKLTHMIAPDLDEEISHQMPAFILQGKVLLRMAANEYNVKFYPTSSSVESFADEIQEAGYVITNSVIEFPLDQSMPYELMKRMIEHGVKEIEGE